MCRHTGTVYFWTNVNWGPQYQAHGHKIDIVDLLKWAHGQAHRHSVFDKC